MLKRLCSFLVALIMLIGMLPMHTQAAESVVINETTFPDANFRAYILSESYGVDGILTSSELRQVTSIDVAGKKIADLSGIEYFTALTYLDCNENQLTELDVSKYTKLTYLVCYSNQLTALDVSHNTALTYLNCAANPLTELDVSKNSMLTSLNCCTNQLTELDVSKNSKLTHLACYNNQLTELDVSKNTLIEYLDCEENQLTKLDVSKNSALQILLCAGNALTELNVSNIETLTELDCRRNPLTKLDVSTNTALRELLCDACQLTELDVSKNTALEYLQCTQNRLNTLNLGCNTVLKFIFCYYNQLTELDLSEVTALTELGCFDNRLTELDVSKNTKLTNLDCRDNQFTILDLSHNAALEYLYCGGNQLTELDVTKNPLLRQLLCDHNSLTELDVSKNTELERLACGVNFVVGGSPITLKELDVSKNTKLKYLDCTGHHLAALDVSKNAELTHLECDRNELTELDVSKNTKLTYLDCYWNELTELDVSKNTKLTYLNCNVNKLTKLDVSKNTALEKLYCYNNYLTALDVSKNTALIDLECSGNDRWIITNKNLIDLSDFTKDGFDASKASNWQGGTVSGNILTATAAHIDYTYDLGNGSTEIFTLRLDNCFLITAQPTSVTAKVGDTVTFKVDFICSAAEYFIQWEYKDPAVGSWYPSEMTGNKSPTLKVGAITSRNGFQYRCKITDGNGDVIYSNAATLTVKSGPSITTQPVSANLKTGSTATFKVVATGTGLTYQWQYKDPAVGTWYNSGMEGNKTATLKVGAIVGRHNFQYRCKVTDGNGNVVYSNAATLTVLGIKTQPASVTAKLNENVNFKVVATGTGLTYQWQYKDPSVGTWYNSGMTGNKTSVMTVEAIAFRNNFQYRCKITDSKGNVIYTNAATLTVKSGPSITSQPSSVTAKLNETVTFKVAATGTGLTYQWQYKNPSVGTWYNSEMTGNKTSAMEVGVIAFRDGFQYRCKVTDSSGNVAYSNAATLTVKSGPSITTQPTSVTAKLNDTVTFKVVATGTGLTYQWQYKNPSVGTWYNSEMTGSKTSVMTVEAIAFRNNFQYRCKVTDSSGNVAYSNAATLTVKSGPSITTQPTSSYLKIGNTANFKVVATGTGLTYQWQYKDPAVGTWYSSTLTGNKTATIQVGATAGRNNFQYRCKITDGNGNVVYSNAATLTVFGIKTQPSSATAKLNENVNFKVSAVGNGLTYQWQYMNPSVGKWYNSEMTGSKTSNMTVEAIAFRNNFQYRCKITDSNGNVFYSNAAKLTVK